jgi:hypothetical protein
MLGIGAATRVYMAIGATDMRKGTRLRAAAHEVSGTEWPQSNGRARAGRAR